MAFRLVVKIEIPSYFDSNNRNVISAHACIVTVTLLVSHSHASCFAKEAQRCCTLCMRHLSHVSSLKLVLLGRHRHGCDICILYQPLE